jgi:hypothetical protein
MRITEVNRGDLEGSMGRNLISGKFWAFTELSKFQRRFDTIYMLGSWYGNAGLMLSMDPRFNFDKIINVEQNKSRLKVGHQLAQLQGYDNIESMYKDANLLDYRQLGDDGLVVNFSCNNIPGKDWFDHIPADTMVLLSGRDNDDQSINQFNDLNSFTSKYKLSKTLFSGQKEFEDPQTKYNLYLVIGIK